MTESTTGIKCALLKKVSIRGSLTPQNPPRSVVMFRLIMTLLNIFTRRAATFSTAAAEPVGTVLMLFVVPTTVRTVAPTTTQVIVLDRVVILPLPWVTLTVMFTVNSSVRPPNMVSLARSTMLRTAQTRALGRTMSPRLQVVSTALPANESLTFSSRFVIGSSVTGSTKSCFMCRSMLKTPLPTPSLFPSKPALSTHTYIGKIRAELKAK